MVEHARDQANALLRRYRGYAEQEPHVRAWLKKMRRSATPPTLLISLAEWEAAAGDAQPAPLEALSLATAGAAYGEESPRSASASATRAGAGPSVARPDTSPLVRAWTIPVGGTLIWSNDLPSGATVSVRVGGVAVRTLKPGERFELLMHTVGVGSYDWRRQDTGAKQKRKKGRKEKGAESAGEEASTHTSLSNITGGESADSTAPKEATESEPIAENRPENKTRYTAEVRVVAFDAITQYGTFSGGSSAPSASQGARRAANRPVSKPDSPSSTHANSNFAGAKSEAEAEEEAVPVLRGWRAALAGNALEKQIQQPPPARVSVLGELSTDATNSEDSARDELLPSEVRVIQLQREAAIADEALAWCDAAFSLYTIVITNMVQCIAYIGKVGGRSYIAQKSRNSIAVVWVMRTGRG